MTRRRARAAATSACRSTGSRRPASGSGSASSSTAGATAAGRQLGTIVGVEGGPGYSTTDSRDYFLELARPLMGRRDLLLVDARGTGLSGPLDCPALRRTVAGYIRRAGRCAAQLGPRVDRYTTRASVDDLADVLDALGIGAVDLYGDSYGSYFGQAFAVNHPDRLRSLVLDGTYPLPGTDPALGDLAEATWRALRLVCERRPGCAARGEDPLAVLERIADRVRARPVRGTGIDGEGRRVRVRLDIPALATLVQSGYGNLPMYRDVIAAMRAFEDGDRAPLLRLVAETTLVPEASPVRSFSDPLYLAVTCHDYPQMWDPAAPLATRRQQLAAARAALPAAQFAPFTGAEWTSLPYEGATACLRWPGPQRPEPPVDPQAPYPAVPTLVVNGDLDNITTTDQALVVASRFPSSTYVETRNTIHVSALGDRDGCAAPIVRRFIRTLSAGDTSCAGRIAEVRTVDRFPRRSAGATPADPRPGDRSTVADRRVAAVGGGHRGRRDPALAAQLRRHAPAACAAGAGPGAATASRAFASRARASPATSRCTAARPGDSGPARSGPISESPAAAGCGRAGTCAARSRRPRSPAVSTNAVCGRRCSRRERRRARAACAARACMRRVCRRGLDRPLRAVGSPGRVVGARPLHRGDLTHGGGGEGVSGGGGAAGCDGDGHDG